MTSPQAPPAPVAVVLCGACGSRRGLNISAIAPAVQAADPAVAVLTLPDLCDDSAPLTSALNREKRAVRLVAVASTSPEAVAGVRQAASRAGLDPFGVEVLDIATADASPERVTAQVAGRIARARAYGGARPENVKLVLPDLGEQVSRRGLLRLLRPRRQVIPMVDADACAGSDRCRLCISACPHEALDTSGEKVCVDTARCQACGLCLPACPPAAIRFPTASPEQLAAEVCGLLAYVRAHGLPGSDAPVIVYTCACAQRTALPPGMFPIEAPCLSMLPVETLLLPFRAGAAGVALACGDCAHDGEGAAWTARLTYAQAVLEAFGAGAARLLAWRRKQGETDEPLRRLRETVRALGPHRLTGVVGQPVAGALAEVLIEWDTRVKASARCIATGTGPFGVVTVNRAACTLCGACAPRCPTGALAFVEEAGSATLSFAHRHCVACDRCVSGCPQKALTVQRTTDISALGAPPQMLAQDTVARCLTCGAPLLPDAIRRHVQARLAGPLGQAVHDDLCPKCRVTSQIAGRV